MLSSEGSVLTELVLARHTLICRAIELDVKFEVLEVLASAQDACTDGPAVATACGPLSASRRRLAAELMVLPALIEDLEGQIERAWQRLDSVSPRVID